MNKRLVLFLVVSVSLVSVVQPADDAKIKRSKQLLEMIAKKQVDMKVVKDLLSAGVDINYTNMSFLQRSAMVWAIYGGYAEIVGMLLDSGVDINKQYGVGDTALMYAVRYEQEEIVRMLLDRGANVNMLGESGNTALIYAAECNNAAIVEMLLKSGANVHLQNVRGQTALMLALHNGSRIIVWMLLMAGADVNQLEEYQGFKKLFRPWDALQEQEIPTLFEQAPKFDDYVKFDDYLVKDPMTGDYRDVEDDDIVEKEIKFHKDFQMYLIYQLQKAYDIFIKNPKSPDKFKPLIDFFCNIMYPRRGEMDAIFAVFKSKDHLIDLLNLLAQYAKNVDEKNKLQELSMLEKTRDVSSRLLNIEESNRENLFSKQEREFEAILEQAEKDLEEKEKKAATVLQEEEERKQFDNEERRARWALEAAQRKAKVEAENKEDLRKMRAENERRGIKSSVAKRPVEETEQRKRIADREMQEFEALQAQQSRERLDILRSKLGERDEREKLSLEQKQEFEKILEQEDIYSEEALFREWIAFLDKIEFNGLESQQNEEKRKISTKEQEADEREKLSLEQERDFEAILQQAELEANDLQEKEERERIAHEGQRALLALHDAEKNAKTTAEIKETTREIREENERMGSIANRLAEETEPKMDVATKAELEKQLKESQERKKRLQEKLDQLHLEERRKLLQRKNDEQQKKENDKKPKE